MCKTKDSLSMHLHYVKLCNTMAINCESLVPRLRMRMSLALPQHKKPTEPETVG